jgi:C-terminal processing protease CtpA/Prc
MKLFKTRTLSPIFLVSVMLLATACKDEAENEHQYVNDWIWDNMQTYYYWTDKLPAESDKTMNPDLYFESLLYKYDAVSRTDGDRFSWIQDDYKSLQDGLSGIVEQEIGFDYRLYLMTQGSDNVVGQITYVKKGTSAEQAGLKRGMWFDKVNGVQLTTSNYRQALAIYTNSFTLSVLNEGYDTGGRFTGFTQGAVLSLSTQADYAEHPVYLDTVYTLDDQTKVGYLVYNFFAPDKGDDKLTYDKAVNRAFYRFKNEGITHLVLDLRYNSGGYSSSGTYLASMIVPVLKDIYVYTYYRYNEAMTNYYMEQYGGKSLNTYFTTAIKKDGQTVETLNAIGQNLQGFYVLTGEYTASASEQLINGLKAYREVVLIGDKTYGKNVASISIYEENDPKNTWGMQPIVAKFFNKNGQSDFTAGFTPNYQVDDVGSLGVKPLGDQDEALLGTALMLIKGEVPAAPALRSSKLQTKQVPTPNALHRGLIIDNGPENP